MAKKFSETPLMAQYNAIKAKHPDATLLFPRRGFLRDVRGRTR